MKKSTSLGENVATSKQTSIKTSLHVTQPNSTCRQIERYRLEVYSQSTAPGIVIGTGNVGSKLLYTADDINTYLSRNGGVDWIEAHENQFLSSVFIKV